jgi:hypothetical protein
MLHSVIYCYQLHDHKTINSSQSILSLHREDVKKEKHIAQGQVEGKYF